MSNRSGCERAIAASIAGYLIPITVYLSRSIIARQHQGATTLDYLALACFHCNRFKGPNIAGLDPESRTLVPIFHPRHDTWSDRFRLDGDQLIGLTAIGRTTIQVLAMNAPDLLHLRSELVAEQIAFD